jgi:hypothetical protein
MFDGSVYDQRSMTMRNVWIVRCALVLSALVAAACEAGAERLAPGLSYDEFETASTAASAASPEASNSSSDRRAAASRLATLYDEAGKKGGPRADDGAGERLLIYRGQIRVEVPRADEAARSFLEAIKAMGGYLQSQTGAAVIVRVPAPRFDDAFAVARSKGRVLDESREANDVTEEFVDLGIRIDNARKARERLLEVLKIAEKVEDILKVEVELRRLTDEIERMEGRKKLLADQVAMATVRAEFPSIVEAPPVKRTRKPSRFPWINRVGADAVMGGF